MRLNDGLARHVKICAAQNSPKFQLFFCHLCELLSRGWFAKSFSCFFFSRQIKAATGQSECSPNKTVVSSCRSLLIIAQRDLSTKAVFAQTNLSAIIKKARLDVFLFPLEPKASPKERLEEYNWKWWNNKKQRAGDQQENKRERGEQKWKIRNWPTFSGDWDSAGVRFFSRNTSDWEFQWKWESHQGTHQATVLLITGDLRC